MNILCTICARKGSIEIKNKEWVFTSKGKSNFKKVKTAFNNIKFAPSASVFNEGKFVLYGVKNS